MPSIRSINFDSDGWVEVEATPEERAWADDPESPSAILSLHFFQVEPNIPVPLNDLKGLRDAYRSGVNQMGAGLVSTDVVLADGLQAVKTIIKIPRQPHGMDYVGSITIPFQLCSYVIKVQAREKGITGLRDSLIADELMDLQEDVMATWARDPYDPAGSYPCMPNKSEDEMYDSRFPEHPLSRVRATLNQAQQTVSFSKDVYELAPFTGT